MLRVAELGSFDKKMKALLSLLGATLLSVGIGCFALWYFVGTPIAEGGITARMAHEIRDYAVENDLMLPATWEELIEWYRTREPNHPTTAASYSSTFNIRKRNLSETADGEIFIEVIDPKLKKMEGNLNRVIRSAIYEKG